MYCYLFHVTQFILLCWTASRLQAQQMRNRDSLSNDNHGSYFFYQRPEYPRDCSEVRDQCSSDTSSGVYLIKPDGYPEPFEVFCDNEDSEAWTVLLRRIYGGGLVFKREWDDYKDGFGFLSQEYWIGNEKLSYLTSQKNYELHINMSYENGSSCYASYDLFRINDDFGSFNVTKLGQYSGNADECMPSCPGNMAPGDCSCEKTCANPSGCINTCDVHTCVCTEGFYLKGEDCVPLAECTRCEVNGINIPEGRSYVSSDCTSRAECRNGQLLWDNTYTCRANAVCDKRNNAWQCYTDDVDCLKVYEDDRNRPSGIYNIKPTNWPGLPFEVYCNMADGGGWTVFQHREDGTFDFYQNWTTYRIGFGSLDHEHWLGNEKLYYLTNQNQYTLRIDFINFDNSPYYATFDFFRINNEADNYRLSQLGSYDGTADERGSSHSSAGYALSYHLNYQFSTHDRDNDVWSSNCAVTYRGAWWYKDCYYSNLNGPRSTSYPCIYWYYLPGTNCNKYVEMKIRPS